MLSYHISAVRTQVQDASHRKTIYGRDRTRDGLALIPFSISLRCITVGILQLMLGSAAPLPKAGGTNDPRTIYCSCLSPAPSGKPALYKHPGRTLDVSSGVGKNMCAGVRCDGFHLFKDAINWLTWTSKGQSLWKSKIRAFLSSFSGKQWELNQAAYFLFWVFNYLPYFWKFLLYISISEQIDSLQGTG